MNIWKTVNKKKLGIGVVVLIVILLFAFIGGIKMYNKSKPYSFEELKKMNLLHLRGAISDEKGIITMSLNITGEIDLTKVDVYSYLVSDGVNEFKEVNFDKDNMGRVTLDIVNPIDRNIEQRLKETNAYIYEDDDYFATETVSTYVERIKLHVVVLPKGYFSENESKKEEASFYEENDMLRLEDTEIKGSMHHNAYKGNYHNYQMYIMSLATNKLSMDDFFSLVKLVRKGVPRNVEVYESELQDFETKNNISSLFNDTTSDYHSTIVYNVLMESYTIGEYFPIAIDSTAQYFLKSVNIAPGEQGLVDDLNVENRIVESQVEYEEAIKQQATKDKVIGTGQLTNCYFNYYESSSIGELLILKQAKNSDGGPLLNDE